MEIKFKKTDIGLIPEDWEVKNIAEISNNYDKNRKPLSTMQRAKMKGNIPYYGAAGIIDYINDFKFEGKYLLVAEDGTVLTDGNKPTLQLTEGKFWVSNHAHVLQCDKFIDTMYLFYQLKNTNIVPFVTGAVQMKLNQNNLNKVEIPWIMDKNERNIVTNLMYDFDQKINLLQEKNETLEEIAKLQFKKWLVKPESIPESWESKSLDQIAEYLNGLAMQKFPMIDENNYLPVIKIRELNGGINEGTDKGSSDINEKYIIQNGDILFSWSGTLKVMIWCGGKGALNQHLFKVSSEEYPKWFYYLWTKHHLDEFIHIAKAKATTMGHIQRKHLKEAKVLVPSKEDMEKMDKVLNPIIQQIINQKKEIMTLTQLRDTLLPKLMSGKIRVPKEVIENVVHS